MILRNLMTYSFTFVESWNLPSELLSAYSQLISQFLKICINTIILASPPCKCVAGCLKL
jgi:hypothetical protein